MAAITDQSLTQAAQSGMPELHLPEAALAPALRAIAAMNEDRVIGRDNRIPWCQPEDLEHFRSLTVGQTLIMGRGTFESLPESRRPLPDRINVVLTHHPDQLKDYPQLMKFTSLADCLEQFRSGKGPAPGGVVWVIGGEDVYRQALPLCSEVYLTIIWNKAAGDRRMPDFENDFRLIKCEAGGECAFLYYQRKQLSTEDPAAPVNRP